MKKRHGEQVIEDLIRPWKAPLLEGFSRHTAIAGPVFNARKDGYELMIYTLLDQGPGKPRRAVVTVLLVASAQMLYYVLKNRYSEGEFVVALGRQLRLLRLQHYMNLEYDRRGPYA